MKLGECDVEEPVACSAAGPADSSRAEEAETVGSRPGFDPDWVVTTPVFLPIPGRAKGSGMGWAGCLTADEPPEQAEQ